MSLFEPLMRVVKIEVPYWMAGIVIVSSALSLITSRFHLQSALLAEFMANCLILFAAAFIILAIYVQVRYEPYSFGDLLPSSALVALIMSTGFLISQRSNESFGAGAGAFMLLISLAVFSPGIAAVVFGFPRILKILMSLLNHG